MNPFKREKIDKIVNTELYENFPEGHVSRRYSVRQDSGDIEAGWIATGAGTDDDGVEFTRLLKYNDDSKEVDERDVPTAELLELHAELSAKRLEKRLASEALRPAVAAPKQVEPLRSSQRDPEDREFGRRLSRAELDVIMKESQELEKERLRKIWGPPETRDL